MSLHLIALHGAGMNAQVWGGLAPHLAVAGYGAAFQAVNLPGHRDTADQRPFLHTVAEMDAWLRQYIDDAPSGKDIVLVGHSLGAAVCCEAAAHHRVVGLVAINSAPRLTVNSELLALAHTDPAAAQALIIKWSCDAKHPQAQVVRDVVTQMMQVPPAGALAADLAACAAMEDVHACRKKVLVISGRFDKMTPLEQGEVLAEKQEAQHIVMDGGHMLPCEHAPDIGHAITDFLAGF